MYGIHIHVDKIRDEKRILFYVRFCLIIKIIKKTYITCDNHKILNYENLHASRHHQYNKNNILLKINNIYDNDENNFTCM